MVVLCIDNDAEDIEFFCDAIKIIDPGITCLSVLDGQGALDLLSSIKDDQLLPGYIFLDVNMPQMDGKDTLKEIRKITRYHSVQIIMLSTGLSPQDTEQYKHLGANNFMSKANSLHEFCEKLKTIFKSNA